MLDKVVELWMKGKKQSILEFSDAVETLSLETKFLDNGDLEAQVKRLQNKSKELEDKYILYQSAGTDVEKKAICAQRIDIAKRIVYCLSQSWSNLESAQDIYRNIDREGNFNKCIDGLLAYKKDDFETAYALLSEYLETGESIKHHYLFNIVYANLLIQEKEYEKAFVYADNARFLKPECLDSYRLIVEIHAKTGRVDNIEIVKEIIKILEG